MRTAWTDGLPQDKKAGVELAVRNSTVALGRLQQIIEKALKALSEEDTKLPEVNEAAYGVRQAHRNGQKAFANKILNLLDLGVK